MKSTCGLFLILMSLNVSARTGGSDIGNGGDQYALAFAATAESVVSWLANHDSGAAVDPTALEAAIQTTVVQSTPQKLLLNGVIKDAINYPDQKKIIFNRASWSRLSTQSARVAWVLHEYLGIMRIDDSNYQISHLLAAGLASGAPEKYISVEDRILVCGATKVVTHTPTGNNRVAAEVYHANPDGGFTLQNSEGCQVSQGSPVTLLVCASDQNAASSIYSLSTDLGVLTRFGANSDSGAGIDIGNAGNSVRCQVLK